MSENMQLTSDYDTIDMLTTSKTFIYTWEIKNIRLLCEKRDNLKSKPSYYDINGKMHLWNISLDITEHLRASISFQTKAAQVTYDNIKLNVYIIDKNKKEHNLDEFESKEQQQVSSFTCIIGKKDFVLNEENGLLQDENLTLKFKLIFTKDEFIYNNINAHSSTNKPKFIELENMFNNDKFSDAQISVDGKEFHVHKVILASRSPVFAAMFEHDMKENIENIVEITDIDHKRMHELIYFMYTGKVNNIEYVAHDLLTAADKYEVEELRLMCEETLIKQLNVKNVITFLIQAEKHRAKILKEKAFEYFKLHLKEIIQTEIFKTELNSFIHLVPDMFKLLADSISIPSVKKPLKFITFVK